MKGVTVKRMILLAVLVIGCVAMWRLGSRLSADAVGMAIGILLGVLASIPTSLLILTRSRRRAESKDAQWEKAQCERTPPVYQPPVIVLTGHAPATQPPMIAPSATPIVDDIWSQRGAARQFKIVGEMDRWAE